MWSKISHVTHSAKPNQTEFHLQPVRLAMVDRQSGDQNQARAFWTYANRTKTSLHPLYKPSWKGSFAKSQQ